MKYDREILGRQIRRFQKAIDDGWITAWHEITTIELFIGKIDNRFMCSEIFDEFDDTEKKKKELVNSQL